MKKLLLLFIIIFSCYTVFAYPISPRPLRQLVMESEYIVMGKVVKLGTKSFRKNQDVWKKDFAVILIQEVLRGNIRENTITVYYSAGMICPQPPHFIMNEDVIAFVNRDTDTSKGYYVPALSYGVKIGIGDRGIALYKTRIKEMQQILALSNVQEKQDRTIEWLVKCAEDTITRWEGVYELSPESDFMSYYDRAPQLRKDLFLSPGQKQRLHTALLATKEPGYYEMGLADIVKGVDDKNLLQFLKTSLSRAETEYFITAKEIMERILLLTGNPELDKLLDEFYDLPDYNADDKKKKILAEFIDKMRHADLRPALAASGNFNS